jgi:hypothetical protein
MWYNCLFCAGFILFGFYCLIQWNVYQHNETFSELNIIVQAWFWVMDEQNDYLLNSEHSISKTKIEFTFIEVI